ncbi:hypothetical protein PTKIN_Ptkin09bG0229500 [Pterospermum kingtungense]
MEPKRLWLSLLILLLLEGCRWYSTDACSEHERIALLQLKPFFNHLNSWVEEVNGLDCCQWERVECNTSSRGVIGLSLNFTKGPNDQSWDWGLNVKDWYLNASLFLPFKELKHLYLPGNGIAGFVENEELSLALGNLEILDLSYNYLDDTILSSLSQLSSLKNLYLGGNFFTGSNHAKGFQSLSRLNNLETLDLGGNSLKKSILFHMGNLSSLKSLSLSANNLEGSIHIQELNNLTKLKNLDLSDNRIESLRSSKGNKIQLRLTNLEVLDLSGNLFRNNTFAFPPGLSSLNSLYMMTNQLQGSIDIIELRNLLNLKTLDLSGNNIESLQSFQDDGGQLIFTNLVELELSGNQFNDSIFSSLKAFPNLKYLRILYNQLKGSIVMKDLAALTSLKELDMSSNDLKEFVAHKGYNSLKKLKILRLNEVFIKRSIPLLKLVEAFPSVKTFFLQGNYLNNTLATQIRLSEVHMIHFRKFKDVLDKNESLRAYLIKVTKFES